MEVPSQEKGFYLIEYKDQTSLLTTYHQTTLKPVKKLFNIFRCDFENQKSMKKNKKEAWNYTMTVIIIGRPYVISLVASIIITVREIVVLAIPAKETKSKKKKIKNERK